MSKSTPVAVIGSGNIGIDLCERLLRDSDFKVQALIGRRPDSPGLSRFAGRIPSLLHTGTSALAEVVREVDGIFDATSAFDHAAHWEVAKRFGKWMIDLTPSQLGVPMVPVLAGRHKEFALNSRSPMNFSMVSCGGQSSAPILWALASSASNVRTVEISSSIASKSAGPATRLNIDEYISATENLGRVIARCEQAKAILVLNPAIPPVLMRTTVHLEADSVDIEKAQRNIREIELATQKYVPGYTISVDAHFSAPKTISATARVRGEGHYLPEYAGNLDIINAAAVETARIAIQDKIGV